MMQRAIRFLQKESTLWGPLSLLCTLALGVKGAIPFDLLFTAAIGLILCACWQLRGCCYSFLLLGVGAVIRHGFFVSDHLWQLGLEGSLACAFLITALAFEQKNILVESLESQIGTGKAALKNLEEELAKTQETSQEQQIIFQEKVAGLQKEFEDLQTEHSSILILNEVLRKTTARHAQESETLSANLLDLQRQMALLKAEYAECQNDLTRLANSDAMATQNRELIKELNAVRYEKEQTHLINETLARLYARENLKAKESEQEVSSLADQLAAAHREVHRITQSREHPPQIAEQLAFAKEKMMHLSQIEPLFKQLKKQFEEKNQVLHETRSELFKSDTELQKLKIEKMALEFNPIPKEAEEEIHALSAQILALEEENRQMEELISVLTDDQTL